MNSKSNYYSEVKAWKKHIKENHKVEEKPEMEVGIFFDYSKAQHKALKNKFGREYHRSFQKIAKAE